MCYFCRGHVIVIHATKMVIEIYIFSALEILELGSCIKNSILAGLGEGKLALRSCIGAVKIILI
jgi:hypothetical protein